MAHPLTYEEISGTSDGVSITDTTSVPKAREGVSRHRTHAIAWTLNNYTEDDIKRCRAWIKDQCDYGCFSQEVSKKGTPHLQGYMHFKNPRDYPNGPFRKLLDRRVHDAPARAGPEKNREYCSGLCEKKGNTLNPTFWEFGDIPKQGSRTDWREALEMARDVGVYAAVEAQPHLIPNIRALERVRQISRTSKMRKMNVIVLHGPTGTGKSYAAWSAFPDLYSKPDGQWWDGYDGQKVVLLDDFNGDVPITTLLKWLDPYPVQLPVKGTFVAAQYETVIITCNRIPYEWYPSADRKHVDALYDRLRVIPTKTIYTQEDIHEYAHQTDVRQERWKERTSTPPSGSPEGSP